MTNSFTTHYKLYIARRERGLTQKDMADKLGLHQQTYHLKEIGNNEFTLTEAKRLAEIFDCTLNDLFS